LQKTPRLRVVLLGAGFDTHAFRLTCGRWIEIDEPALEESKLPASGAPNRLERIGVDFAQDSIADKLAPWAGESPVTVVMEGFALCELCQVNASPTFSDSAKTNQ